MAGEARRLLLRRSGAAVAGGIVRPARVVRAAPRKAGSEERLAQLTASIRGVKRLHGDKAPLVKRIIREASEA